MAERPTFFYNKSIKAFRPAHRRAQGRAAPGSKAFRPAHRGRRAVQRRAAKRSGRRTAGRRAVQRRATQRTARGALPWAREKERAMGYETAVEGTEAYHDGDNNISVRGVRDCGHGHFAAGISDVSECAGRKAAARGSGRTARPAGVYPAGRAAGAVSGRRGGRGGSPVLRARRHRYDRHLPRALERSARRGLC